MDEEALRLGNMALLIIEEARRFKSESSLSMASPLEALEISAPASDLQGLMEFESDLLSVTRAERISWSDGQGLETKVVPSAE